MLSHENEITVPSLRDLCGDAFDCSASTPRDVVHAMQGVTQTTEAMMIDLASTHRPYQRGLTRYFCFSGLCLIGFFAYMALWSIGAQKLTGDDLFGIGTPAELIVALRGGGIVAILMLFGFMWLLLTGFASRGAALRQRDHRIAELESKLRELSRT